MSINLRFYEEAVKLHRQALSFVSVSVVESVGSIPQGVGAKMIVSSAGLYWGSVGGGRLEAFSIEKAQALLSGNQTHLLENINLNRDLGMTCGGQARLFFEVVKPQWDIVVFGAGHVGNRIVHLLADLNCMIHCVDHRPEWMAQLPDKANVSRRLVEKYPDGVAGSPEGAFVILMTPSHRFDMEILREIFRGQRSFPYIGVIGSKSKAARIKQAIADEFSPEVANQMYCPIGLPLGNNTPSEIAISIVAQLLQLRDQTAEIK